MVEQYRFGNPPPPAVKYRRRRAEERKQAALQRAWLASRLSAVEERLGLGSVSGVLPRPEGSPDKQPERLMS